MSEEDFCSHPLGVTLGKVVVDGDHVDTLARESVEKHRKGRDEGLSLTRGHLGDLALMEGYASDELDVVMHHVPGDFVASGQPVVVPDGLVALYRDEVVPHGEILIEPGGRHDHGFVLLEAAGRGLHDRESLGKHLVEALLDGFVLFLDQLVRLIGELLLLGDGYVPVELLPYLGYAVFERALHLGELLTQRRRTGAQFIVGQGVDLRIDLEDLLQHGLHGIIIAVGLGAEQLPYY